MKEKTFYFSDSEIADAFYAADWIMDLIKKEDDDDVLAVDSDLMEVAEDTRQAVSDKASGWVGLSIEGKIFKITVEEIGTARAEATIVIETSFTI